MLHILKIPTEFGIVPQSFCKNINPFQSLDQYQDPMILLWISTPELQFIHTRHPPNFVWIRLLLLKLLFPRPESTYVQLDRQTGENFFCSF